MAALPDVIRQSELLNQLVLNRSTLEELGRIEVLWMYPPAHRVLGFVCRTGFLGNKKLAFKLSQVEAIGGNGILTHSQPDQTDAERVRQLESLIQSEVWSNAGHKLGKIVDCVFDLRSGAITDYLITGDRFSTLTGSIYRLPPSAIVSLGRRRVLVAERSLQSFVTYQEGIPQKLSKVGAELKEEYEQVTQELRSLTRRAQETTQQTTAQVKTLAEQAKERAQILAEQAKERAQELNEQLVENAQVLVERAKETSETLIERVQSTAQDWKETGFDEGFDEGFEPEDDRPLDDDSAFDFDEEDTTKPTSPPETATRQQPQPVPDRTEPPATVTKPIAQTEPAIDETEADIWTIDTPATSSSTWNADRPSASNVSSPQDEEEDPWNITEPPAVEVPVQPVLRSPPSQKDDEDEPWV